jgi:hypothetical protein
MADEERSTTCATCRWFDLTNKLSGLCRATAPSPKPGTVPLDPQFTKPR